MNLCDLVGKKVIRTEPMQNKDRSFMDTDSEVTVVDFVDGVAIVKVKSRMSERVMAFTGYLNDDKWMDATNVYARIEQEEHSISLQYNKQ